MIHVCYGLGFEAPPYSTFCVDFAMDLSFELDPDVDSDAAHPSNRRDQYCTGRCIPVGFGSASDNVDWDSVDPLASNRRVQNCRARCIPVEHGSASDNVRFDAAESDTCWEGKR